jgi:ABC-type nickel/cobalt efflux system permease component RcnA
MGRLMGMGLLSLLAALWSPVWAAAHLIDPDNHDRFAEVHLTANPAAREVVVVVEYRLEVKENTALGNDLQGLQELDLVKFRQGPYREYARCFGLELMANLDAKVDGRALTFTCTKRTNTLRDEQHRRLGHLRCDYVFQAAVKVRPARRHRLVFVDNNFREGDKGSLRLSFTGRRPVRVVKKTVPSPALQERDPTLFGPGDEDRLRTVDVKFSFSTKKTKALPGTTPPTTKGATDAGSADDEAAGDGWDLKDLFFRSKHGLLVLLVLAAAFGAVHALTPGHGKTLVAAYLVGERGTAWHAVFLGLVTTLTHTGVVLVLAAVLYWYFPRGMSAEARQDVQTTLGLCGGLVITLLGFWLLLRRLSGRADHFHLGGHGHHHHHGDGHHHHHHHGHAADHYHDEHGHVHPQPGKTGRVSWWGLAVLGISGGLIPCWDAIFILLFAVAKDMVWLALPLVLAFSAGLAGVLVLIGILVVYAKGFAGSHWGESRFFRALPLVSAAAVAALGLWVCYSSLPGNV